MSVKRENGGEIGSKINWVQHVGYDVDEHAKDVVAIFDLPTGCWLTEANDEEGRIAPADPHNARGSGA